MGVFDFIKGAGEKLLELNPAKKISDVLIEQVRKHRLGKGDIKVEAEGGKVKVSGTAANQAEKEKIVLAMGNVYGIERVEEDIKLASTPTSTPEPAAQMYTVVKGDTLSKISKQFYGSAQKYQRIFEANRPMLQHPDKIYPGQVLRIPPKI